MVTCPRCGGSKVEQVDVGLWKCHNRWIEEFRGPGMDPRDPSLPHIEHIPASCGHTWHQPTARPTGDTPLCRCGTFAVGYCARCGNAVCVLHSEVKGDSRLCTWLKNDDLLRRSEVLTEQDAQEREYLSRRGDPAFMDKIYTNLLRVLRERGRATDAVVEVVTLGKAKRTVFGNLKRYTTRTAVVTRGWQVYLTDPHDWIEGDGWSATSWTSRSQQIFGEDGGWWDVSEGVSWDHLGGVLPQVEMRPQRACSDRIKT
ncbi:hypothetical protein LWF15_19445 [Kineosporia rhizophila]|uniref:hypothetical protein n=1 Tax=Kineosporia rhizophila TaxID=84633 RepID=UPI001E57DCF2|nr:hypothetical protein [Kineosporia rhizophila]MCE0537669.1 hypothetical protein [Kineosporia rhizophila]